MPRIFRQPVRAPYRARIGALGDDPATIPEIIAAGFDPEADGITYTVDANGDVMQNVTVTATNPVTTAAKQPIWPLLVIMAVAGFATFQAGKHS